MERSSARGCTASHEHTSLPGRAGGDGEDQQSDHRKWRPQEQQNKDKKELEDNFKFLGESWKAERNGSEDSRAASYADFCRAAMHAGVRKRAREANRERA